LIVSFFLDFTILTKVIELLIKGEEFINLDHVYLLCLSYVELTSTSFSFIMRFSFIYFDYN